MRLHEKHRSRNFVMQSRGLHGYSFEGVRQGQCRNDIFVDGRPDEMVAVIITQNILAEMEDAITWGKFIIKDGNRNGDGLFVACGTIVIIVV